MSAHDVFQRRFERERQARFEAERLLEEKSRELYSANLDLQALACRFQEQAKHTQAIVDNAAEGIITLDANGLIETLNRSVERIFGYRADEIIGCNFKNLILENSCLHPAMLQSVAEPLDSPWLEEGWHELVGRTVRGDEIYIELVSSKVTVDDRDFFTAIIRDVTRRKQLETQLAHSQKMESVGQLAAGIAHEINTPIQYVGDNVRFLDDAFQNIQRLLDCYKQLSSAVGNKNDTSAILEQIEAIELEADVDFLCEEVPEAIKQSLDGALRVAKIVRAMKEFSHPGGDEKQVIDLNRAIDSTLTVSKNEWKYIAEMKTNFDEALPLVACFPSDLNQAVLNIIVNSAHAIEAKAKSDPQAMGNFISISTRRNNDLVEIQIEDTGTGIPEHLINRIFDPFFTTKEVGKGTGQGLAIVYSVIVDKHGGSIDVDSTLGVGTKFFLRLPLSSGVSTVEERSKMAGPSIG